MRIRKKCFDFGYDWVFFAKTFDIDIKQFYGNAFIFMWVTL